MGHNSKIYWKAIAAVRKPAKKVQSFIYPPKKVTFENCETRRPTFYMKFVRIKVPDADLRGPGARPPPPTPNLEAQIFAAAGTKLRDVDKISLAPPPPPHTHTQILDPHLTVQSHNVDFHCKN